MQGRIVTRSLGPHINTICIMYTTIHGFRKIQVLYLILMTTKTIPSKTWNESNFQYQKNSNLKEHTLESVRNTKALCVIVTAATKCCSSLQNISLQGVTKKYLISFIYKVAYNNASHLLWSLCMKSF